ncbi:MAG TPA: ATP-binding protein [Verrucomicrobiae bacterium]|jgi:signal transduction histidine kinase|nr:ATP-binding protein [Verrucomicrobiae bacterium]
MDDATLQTIRQTPLFAGLADDQLGCIRLGDVIELPPKSIVAREGEMSPFFYLTLSGETQLWRSYDKQDVLMAVSKHGHFMGEIAILLDSPWLATARVTKTARFFRLDKDGFWKMLSSCPSVTQEILRTVAERFRNIEGYASQREKLISLGTMAAGLAHELNNPASAALRSASYLQQVSEAAQALLGELIRALDPAAWDRLLAAAEDAVARLKTAPPLDSVARSDREEALGTWLEQHQVAEGWKLAGTFVAAGLDAAWLEPLLAGLPTKSHAAALSWIEARLNLKLLVTQVENSASRVVELVKAVKSYTHMDKSPMQEIDIHEGIESTMTMLTHKLKNVTVRRAFDRTLPRLMAYAGELNQVWTNLIDNAIDAAGGKGKLCVATFLEDDYIIVEIADNGPGIPKEIQSRIFEPFFTTKAVGSGTGLGLVISHRIVADRHGGEIEFESKPGETRFKVRLPLRRTIPA